MRLIIGIAIVALLLAVIVVWGKPYGEYRKDRCEWCGTKGNIFNQLNVHHFTPQHIAPELRDDPNNLITLCRADHFSLGHKRNWTNSVPEIKVLFRREQGL